MQELVKVVAEQVSVPIVTSSRRSLIKLEDCERFLEGCKEKEILILGIEGFRKRASSMIAEIDLIADYSSLLGKEWETSFRTSILSAQAFFAALTKEVGLLFEFELRAKNQNCGKAE